MDLLFYLLALVIIGKLRIGTTENVADTQQYSSIVKPSFDLPISSNLKLEKEAGAYTLILEDLGLL